MNSPRRDKALAALLTLLIAALLTCALFVVTVGPIVPSVRPAEQQEVFFAEIDIPDFQEYLSDPADELNENPSSSTPGEPGGADVEDSGYAESEPTLVAAEEPQPENQRVQKPEEKPEPAAPTREEIEAEQKSRANSRLGRVTWDKKTDKDGAGGQNPAGKAEKGDNPESGGLDIDGRSLRRKVTPNLPSKYDLKGVVRIKIYVDSDGKVMSSPKPEVVSSTGLGPDEAEIQKVLLETTAQLLYSADKDKKRQYAIITWRI